MLYIGRHNRIKSEGRFIVFLLTVMVLVVVLTNGVMGLSNADGMTKDTYMTVEVKAGDTLWDIAKTYMGTKEDIRKSVYRLEKLNGLKAGDLAPGMELSIPL
ncbi:MAG: LysM peptidoglycan-binding domain-containing protein [Anaerovoracaceae bacterium]|nr:LysM peptidoglycan-binding domain-containing protein [Clostridiales bacterium]